MRMMMMSRPQWWYPRCQWGHDYGARFLSYWWSTEKLANNWWHLSMLLQACSWHQYVKPPFSHVFSMCHQSCKQKSRGLEGSLIQVTWNQQVICVSMQGSVGLPSRCFHWQVKPVDEVCATTVKGILDLQSIMAAFKRRVKISDISHTGSTQRLVKGRDSLVGCRKARALLYCQWPWLSKLMKTEELNVYIPSPTTVSHDVKKGLCEHTKHIERCCRSMTVHLTLQQMCGRHQTTRHSLQ